MSVQGQEPAQAGLKLGQVLISGRLAGVRSISTRQGRKWLHKVQLPAPMSSLRRPWWKCEAMRSWASRSAT